MPRCGYRSRRSRMIWLQIVGWIVLFATALGATALGAEAPQQAEAPRGDDSFKPVSPEWAMQYAKDLSPRILDVRQSVKNCFAAQPCRVGPDRFTANGSMWNVLCEKCQ